MDAVADLTPTHRDVVDLVADFGAQRVLVVGDALLDVYLSGPAERLCREGPVPVVHLTSRVACPGAAANAAANLAALGASVTLVGVVGADPAGVELRARLDDAGVDTGGVVADEQRRTLTLTRLRADGQLLARYDDGDRGPLGAQVQATLAAAVARAYPRADAVLVSDYAHGTLTGAVQDELLVQQSRHRPTAVVDAKHVAAWRALRPTAVTPNWAEAVRLLGNGELDGVDERALGIAAHGERILDQAGALLAAVTLDRDGAVLFERGQPPHRTYAQPRPDGRAIGAGDTYVATFTLALAAGATGPAAAELASRAADTALADPATAVCTAPALVARFAGEDKVAPDVAALADRTAAARRAGRRVVLTNGCFDLLHRGHVTYLNRAKTLGDVLVVAVNGDGSVRRLKGPGRPVNPVADRVAVLGGLSCVDHLLVFDHDTCERVLAAVRPDVYVKGGDHRLEDLPEAPVAQRLGIDVRLLPLMADRSTTRVIDRIRGTA